MVKTYLGGLVSLSTLAFSLPLLLLLGEYPEFFTSHKIESEHLLVFVSLVLFVLPLLLSIVIVFSSLINRRLAEAVQIVFVILLLVIILLPIFSKFTFLSTELGIGFALGFGIIFGWWYKNNEALRSSLFLISPLILILPLSFLLNAGIQDLAFPKKWTMSEASKEILPTPVVMVIFDEFTINSVINRQGEIDEILYPNLYWFSQQSHWFRNATTVADGTAYAVPAILSGQYAQQTQPTYQAYPVNIFSLLQNTHTFNAHESASKLCPPNLCPPITHRRSFIQHIVLLGLDAMVLYVHIIVPKPYSSVLPDISQGWVNFLAPVNDGSANDGSVMNGEKVTVEQETSGQGWLLGLILSFLDDDRAALWHQFLASIPNTPQPSLNLIHILLPHVALEYLPSGKNYGRQVISGLYDEKWNDDNWAVNQAWQRHLLQLAYVDKLLGELFERLKSEALFDQALIVLTADHGLSFRVGQSRRPVTDENYMDILPVPLFIKLPDQKQGSVSDVNVETVDILPTIVDLLGIPLTTPLAGVSVFDDEGILKRKRKMIFTFNKGERTLQFPSELLAKNQVIADRIALFGDDDDPDKLFAMGPDKHWIGQTLSGETLLPIESSFTLEMKARVDQRVYDSFSGPNYISGTLFEISGIKVRQPPYRLAVAVNGEIKAVSKSFLSTEIGRHDFSFLIPESAYEAGKSRLEIFTINKDKDGENQLFRFKPTKATVYKKTTVDHLQSSASKETSKEISKEILLDENEHQFLIESGSLVGFLDTIEVSDGLYRFDGWAADLKENDTAYEVVLFLNGQYLSSAVPTLLRPDVVSAYNNEAFLSSGYSLYAEMDKITGFCDGLLAIYAVSKAGVASRLKIPESSLKDTCGG